MSFGILTLATAKDYKKAIGLALSVRVSNPGIPIAVACSPSVAPLIGPYFDFIVPEDPSLRGFSHKLHLDRYSPFEETFFFDSDVLVFRPLEGVLDRWRAQPYSACGYYLRTGVSTFGLDKVHVLNVIGHKELVCIDGAGHAYFRKPGCVELFDLAREIAADYPKFTGRVIPLADEDVVAIAMTILDLKPMSDPEFWSRYLSGKRGTVQIDATNAKCVMQLVVSSEVQRPYMMHFAMNEAPFVYAAQLRRLFRRFGLSTNGLIRGAFEDFYVTEIEWPLRSAAKKLFASIKRVQTL